MKFEASAEAILKMETDLKDLDNILRFILIKSVRESKMISLKRSVLSGSTKDSGVTGAVTKKEAEEPISEVEVDKAIEELIYRFINEAKERLKKQPELVENPSNFLEAL